MNDTITISVLPSEYDTYKRMVDSMSAGTEWKIADNQLVEIGQDFKIRGKELKLCLRMLLEQAQGKYPEEFL